MVTTQELKNNPIYNIPTGWRRSWYDLLDIYPFLFKVVNATSKNIDKKLKYDVNSISVASADQDVKQANGYAQYKMRISYFDGTNLFSDNLFRIRVESYQQGNNYILIDEQKVQFICDPTKKNNFFKHNFIVLGHTGYFAYGDFNWIYNQDFYEMVSYNHISTNGKSKIRWYRKYNIEKLYAAGFLYLVIDDIPANKNVMLKVINNEETEICRDLNKENYNLDHCFLGMTHIPYDPKISDYIYWGNKKSNGAHKLDTIKNMVSFLKNNVGVDETEIQIKKACYYQLNKDGGKITVHKNNNAYEFYVSRTEASIEAFEEKKINKKLVKANAAGFNTIEEFEAHKKIVHSKLVMIRKYMKAHPGKANPNWTEEEIGLVWTALAEDEQLIIKDMSQQH